MLDSIGDTALRRTIGGLCIGNAGLAIHGTNAENVLTGAAVTLTHNGVCNAFAAQTEIDLSGKTAYDDIKVVNASGANFTIGKNDFDASGITTTFSSLSTIPPRAV